MKKPPEKTPPTFPFVKPFLSLKAKLHTNQYLEG
jgi:hypothetical protein